MYACVMYEGLYRRVYYLRMQDMSEQRHIVQEKYRKTVQQTYTNSEEKMSKANSKKEISTKLAKGLLDLIILQLLNTQPMHGYQIMDRIRKDFGVYFGPSTIYPLLGTLEKTGYVDSHWDMNFERPKKIYNLTSDGQKMLNFTEDSLNLICKKITVSNSQDIG